MAVPKLTLLEFRVALLEAELARSNAVVATLTTQVRELNRKLESNGNAEKPQEDWVDKIWGTFANDPGFDEVIELGRKYRESLRPKPARKKSGKEARKRKD